MNTILFTGSNGFLGKNIIPILRGNNYKVTTLDLQDADISCDISSVPPEINKKFDIVIHAAAKAHVMPKNRLDENDFFAVNLEGTKNLCNGLERFAAPKSIIFISTVAVYGLDSGEEITEDYPLNGSTPYAKSKVQAEKFLIKWCQEHKIKLSVLRPALFAGPSPPGNLGDMINMIKKSRYFSIAGGKARKSLLMVQDIAGLIPLLASRGGIFNVCDTYHPSFRELEMLIAGQAGKTVPLSIPGVVARAAAIIGDYSHGLIPLNSAKLDKILLPLTFSNEKLKSELGWEPLSVLDNFKIE